MSLWIGSSLLKLSFFLASYQIMLLLRAACAVGFKLGLLLVAAIMIGSTVAGSSDKDKDKEECIQQVAVLATCLPYVGGEAKAPTPDCCSGLKQVLKNNKKCLCVIIRDRNDPDLGVNINVTLALSLPTVCSAPANVSKCPELLHMDPNSPEAQVFYQFSKGSNGGAKSPAPSSSSTAGNPISSKSEGANSTQKGDGCRSSTSIGIMEIAIGCGLLLWQLHFLPFQFFI